METSAIEFEGLLNLGKASAFEEANQTSYISDFEDELSEFELLSNFIYKLWASPSSAKFPYIPSIIIRSRPRPSWRVPSSVRIASQYLKQIQNERSKPLLNTMLNFKQSNQRLGKLASYYDIKMCYCYLDLNFIEPKDKKSSNCIEQLIVRLLSHYATLMQDDSRVTDMGLEEETCALIDRGLYFNDGLSEYFKLKSLYKTDGSNVYLNNIITPMILTTARKSCEIVEEFKE